MRKLVALLLLLVGASALEFSYDGEVMLPPGEERVVNIYVRTGNESGRFPVGCESELRVSCPGWVEAGEGMEVAVPVKVVGERGGHPVAVSLGGERLEFQVTCTNQTHRLWEMLADYNRTFARLEGKYGPNTLLDLGDELVSEGFYLYEQGDYVAVEDMRGNLQALLDEYYSEIELPEEEEPVRLGASYVPLAVGAALVAAYYLRKRGRERDEERREGREETARELRQIVEEEFRG